MSINILEADASPVAVPVSVAVVEDGRDDRLAVTIEGRYMPEWTEMVKDRSLYVTRSFERQKGEAVPDLVLRISTVDPLAEAKATPPLFPEIVAQGSAEAQQPIDFDMMRR